LSYSSSVMNEDDKLGAISDSFGTKYVLPAPSP